MSARFRRSQPVDLRFFGREQRDHIRRVLKRRTTVAQSASHESRGCIERGGINYPGIPVAANVAININREITISKITLVLTLFPILRLKIFQTKMALIRKIRFSYFYHPAKGSKKCTNMLRTSFIVPFIQNTRYILLQLFACSES